MNIKDPFHKQPTHPGVPIPSRDASLQLPIAIPQSIGPYKIESLLEKGGMSLLYLGTHPDNKEPVTIKVLSPKFLSHPEIVQHFLNEAEIIAMADHPNIVKLYGHGEWAGGLYIAMEFVQGISLREHLLQTPMSLKRALEIILDIAYALCHLHTHGVIHRDLKPENILVNDHSGAIKVIDFGIAQLLTEKSPQDAYPKQRILGTPIYMSPEQRENPETVSYPSDIYSLGIISYELVLGKLSHGQIHISLMPKGLQKIISKALQFKPEDRYQDIVDFITEVTAYLNSANLLKEKKVGDQISELFDHIKHAQNLLIPSIPPQWPSIEVGVKLHKGIKVVGVYYDFFAFPNKTYGILMAECSAPGAVGIVYTAIFRGMFRALCQLVADPIELMVLLNDLLSKDPMQQIFTLSYILLSPESQELRYISCGYGTLWYIPAGVDQPTKITNENHALGLEPQIEFAEAVHTWRQGDTLILSSFGNMYSLGDDVDYADKLFRQMLIENAGLPPQQLVDGLLRKIVINSSKQLQGHVLTLIGVSFR